MDKIINNRFYIFGLGLFLGVTGLYAAINATPKLFNFEKSETFVECSTNLKICEDELAEFKLKNPVSKEELRQEKRRVEDLNEKLEAETSRCNSLAEKNSILQTSLKQEKMEKSKLVKPATKSWNYRVFAHTDLSSLEQWLNSINAGSDDVNAALSKNTFHVWARSGSVPPSGVWKNAHEKWDGQSQHNTKDGLINKNRIILGLSNDDFHFLRLE